LAIFTPIFITTHSITQTTTNVNKIIDKFIFYTKLYIKLDQSAYNEKNTDNFIMHIHMWRIDRAQCIIQHEHTCLSRKKLSPCQTMHQKLHNHRQPRCRKSRRPPMQTESPVTSDYDTFSPNEPSLVST